MVSTRFASRSSSFAARALATKAAKPAKARSNVKKFKIYRCVCDAFRHSTLVCVCYSWNPDTGDAPKIQDFDVNLKECGPMVLDALIKIKVCVALSVAFRSGADCELVLRCRTRSTRR